jgi:methylated-DNA-[protein]-cysteine S-methyltransferase
MDKHMNKEYACIHNTPFGKFVLISDDYHLLKLCPFEHFTGQMQNSSEDTYPLRSAVKWLDAYFSGEAPSPKALPLSLKGTPFQEQCWKLLQEIPYGHTTTYKEIALKLAANSPSGKMSCQAVGQAIHKNPIAIIIPCHRVIGSNGSLIGYASGLDLKQKLLIHERAI